MVSHGKLWRNCHTFREFFVASILAALVMVNHSCDGFDGYQYLFFFP